MIQKASLLIAIVVAAFIFMIDPTSSGLGGASLVAISIGYMGARLEDWLDPPLLDDLDEGKDL